LFEVLVIGLVLGNLFAQVVFDADVRVAAQEQVVEGGFGCRVRLADGLSGVGYRGEVGWVE
jgi:hypothetical protein